MRRSQLVGAAFGAAVAVATLGGPGVFGSGREAPKILKLPALDSTGLYAFSANDAPGSLTVVATWGPYQDPSGGPYFGKLDTKARYRIRIDNTGYGRVDVAYRWQFKQQFRNPDSFLYAKPTVASIGDPNLNWVQTYDLVKETYQNGVLKHVRRIARDAPVVPDNVGPKTMPTYPALAAEGITPLADGGKVWVGPADDPSFLDLAVLFDGINIDRPGRPNIGLGNQGGGKDDLAGYKTHAFVLQVPESEVTRDGQPVADAGASNAVVGVWATAEVSDGSDWFQVSRLGNPLINTVFVPIGEKDRFNRTSPAHDADLFADFLLNPELARLLNELFNLGIKETDRTDLVQALLRGTPGLNQIGSNPRLADTLKINLGVAPSVSPSRFGLLAGDLGGFPNGRRLIDDVVDIELRMVAGTLLPADQGGKQIPLGDGVDQNDMPFQSTFPYVALGLDAFSSSLKRIEPAHAPVPEPPN